MRTYMAAQTCSKSGEKGDSSLDLLHRVITVVGQCLLSLPQGTLRSETNKWDETLKTLSSLNPNVLKSMIKHSWGLCLRSLTFASFKKAQGKSSDESWRWISERWTYPSSYSNEHWNRRRIVDKGCCNTGGAEPNTQSQASMDEQFIDSLNARISQMGSVRDSFQEDNEPSPLESFEGASDDELARRFNNRLEEVSSEAPDDSVPLTGPSRYLPQST